MAEIKQYVNLDPTNPDELKDIKPERAGRIINVTAKLNKKKEGVTIVFEIVSGKDNVYPSLDKANFSNEELKGLYKIRKFLPGLKLPMSAKRKVITDDEGKADMSFTLSNFGGDEFEVKAYVLKSGNKRGKEVILGKYIVWRRIYYQVSRFKAGTVGANWKGTLPEIPNIPWDPIKKEYTSKKRNIELVDDSKTDLITRYKNILVSMDPYNDLKKSVKEGYDAKREPVSMRVVLANMIADHKTTLINKHIVIERKPKTLSITSGQLWKDSSLDLGKDCVLDAYVQYNENDAYRPIKNTFIYAETDKKITIRFDLIEQSVYEASFGKKPVMAKITLRLRLLDGSTNGLSWYNAIWLAHNSMHDNTPYSNEGKQSTAIHEIGHFVDMVDTNQETWYDEHGHTGDHCSTGLSIAEKKLTEYTGLNGTCVMFGEGDGRASKITNFCEVCDPSVRKSKVRITHNMPNNW